MGVEEVINLFFEELRTTLYTQGKFLEADKVRNMRDKLVNYVSSCATFLDAAQLDGVYDDGKMDGYAEAVDNLEGLVHKYRSLFKDEKAFIQFKNEVDHCL